MTIQQLTETADDPTQPHVIAHDHGEHLHFLNHLATRKVTAASGGSMVATEFFAPRGFGPPLHVHHDEDELMVLLDGEIEFRSGDTAEMGSTGATVWLPAGIPHTFQVHSETARFVVVSAGRTKAPAFDQFVAELGAPTDRAALPEPGPIDPGHVATVAAKHGMEILGPPPAPLD